MSYNEADTGQRAKEHEVSEHYKAHDYEAKLQIPERVIAMCDDLFQYLNETGGLVDLGG